MPAITGTTSHALTPNNQASLTFAHTATGDVLYVSAFINSATNPLRTVTYGGASLERIGRVTGSSVAHEWWFLSSPAVGTANVVLTLTSGTQWISAGARNVSGVDRDGIFRNLTSATGTSTAPSVTVTSAVGDLVLDLVGNATNSQVFTPGAGQTAQWAQNSLATTDIYTAGSAEAGAASVTMSWTLSISGAWFLSGLSVPAEGTIPPPTVGVTQYAVEVLSLAVIPARVTQYAVEVLSENLVVLGGERVDLFVWGPI